MLHQDFARAEMRARTERYQAEAATAAKVRTERRFRWFRLRKRDQRIGRLRPRGVG